MATSVLEGFAWTAGALDRRKVVQCALSRVCAGCGKPLGRPVAFLGNDDEVGRNSFHVPPLHVACAEDLRAAGGGELQVVLTGGFEYVRPARDDLDRDPRFEPNSLL
ncbi:MAG: hypothetical protein JWQ74_2189 [Marmoricola sp.]|nr:hypothetical protein [Marmoricola sp.]